MASLQSSPTRVLWHESDVTFDKRMDKYRKYQFLPEHLDVRVPAPAVHALLLHAALLIIGTEQGLQGQAEWHDNLSNSILLKGSCGTICFALMSSEWHCCSNPLHAAAWGADTAALQIHWFSIINSCVTVLLLTGFLATILMRVLKNDFVKYTRDDDGARPCCLGRHDLCTVIVLSISMATARLPATLTRAHYSCCTRLESLSHNGTLS